MRHTPNQKTVVASKGGVDVDVGTRRSRRTRTVVPRRRIVSGTGVRREQVRGLSSLSTQCLLPDSLFNTWEGGHRRSVG